MPGFITRRVRGAIRGGNGRAMQWLTSHDFQLEMLPPRILLSASVSGQYLKIEGSDGPDVMRIVEGPKAYKIQVFGVPGVADGTVFTLGGGGGVSVVGKGGDDRIEVAITSSVDGPVVDGGAGNDVLINTGGYAILRGGPGADTIQGLGRTDEIDYSDSPSGIVVRLDQGLVSNDGFGYQDVVSGIDGVEGSWKDDVIYGGGADAGRQSLYGYGGDDLIVGADGINTYFDGWSGNDTLTGGSGDDEFWAREGNDVIDGGAGIDKIAFRYITQTGVVVRLDLGVVQRDGSGGRDTVANVENVDGSQKADIIHGDAGQNQINGNGGRDIIVQDGNGIDDTSNQQPPTPPSFDKARYIEGGSSAALIITGTDGADSIRIEWIGVSGSSYPRLYDVAVYGVQGVPEGFLFHDVSNVEVEALAGDDTIQSTGGAGGTSGCAAGRATTPSPPMPPTRISRAGLGMTFTTPAARIITFHSVT